MNSGPTAVIAVVCIVATLGVVGAVIQPLQTTAILGFSGMICVSLFTLLQGMLAATKVAEVAATAKVAERKVDALAVATDHVSQTVQAVHVLSNSQAGTQLKAYAMLARRMADTSGDKADVAIADEAERAYEIHQSKQAVVDANPPPAPLPPMPAELPPREGSSDPPPN